MERKLLTVVEAARVLGLGRTKVYQLIHSGRLRSVKIDGCRRIPVSALDEYIASLSGEAA
jgi:excisionase family DNA binding protein